MFAHVNVYNKAYSLDVHIYSIQTVKSTVSMLTTRTQGGPTLPKPRVQPSLACHQKRDCIWHAELCSSIQGKPWSYHWHRRPDEAIPQLLQRHWKVWRWLYNITIDTTAPPVICMTRLAIMTDTIQAQLDYMKSKFDTICIKLLIRAYQITLYYIIGQQGSQYGTYKLS